MQLSTKRGCPLAGADRRMKGAGRPAASPRGDRAWGWQRGGGEEPPSASASGRGSPPGLPSPEGPSSKSRGVRSACGGGTAVLRPGGASGPPVSVSSPPGSPRRAGPLLRERVGPVPRQDYTSRRAPRGATAARSMPGARRLDPQRHRRLHVLPLPPARHRPLFPWGGWGLVPLSDFSTAQSALPVARVVTTERREGAGLGRQPGR